MKINLNIYKVAVIGIYEDNAAVYEYHIDDVKYNDDKTIATIAKLYYTVE